MLRQKIALMSFTIVSNELAVSIKSCALDFNAGSLNTQFASVDAPVGFNRTAQEDFTLESRIALNSSTTNATWMDIPADFASNRATFILTKTSANNSKLTISQNGTNIDLAFGSNIFDGVCHNIAISKKYVNASSTVYKLYLDGMLKTTSTQTTAIYLDPDTTDKVYFGGYVTSSSDLSAINLANPKPLKGQFNNIRFWSVARTDVQINGFDAAALFTNPYATGLEAYWRMVTKIQRNELNSVSLSNQLNRGLISGDEINVEPQWIDGTCSNFARQETENEEENLVNNKNESLIKAYPNPSSDELIIVVTEEDNQELASVTLINSLGLEVYKNTKVQLNQEYKLLGTENLAGGIYFMQVKTKSQTKVIKVIKN